MSDTTETGKDSVSIDSTLIAGDVWEISFIGIPEARYNELLSNLRDCRNLLAELETVIPEADFPNWSAIMDTWANDIE